MAFFRARNVLFDCSLTMSLVGLISRFLVLYSCFTGILMMLDQIFHLDLDFEKALTTHACLLLFCLDKNLSFFCNKLCSTIILDNIRSIITDRNILEYFLPLTLTFYTSLVQQRKFRVDINNSQNPENPLFYFMDLLK